MKQKHGCSGAGGQFLSSIVGCVVRQIFPQHLSWVSAAFGVAAAIFVMIVTRTVHPPGAPPLGAPYCHACFLQTHAMRL